MVDHTRLSAGATSSDGTIVADIVGSHVLLPVNSLLPDVHEIVHPEPALQRAASYTALKDVVGPSPAKHFCDVFAGI